MDFENFVLQLSPSDLIQIAGIIVSLICSLIAIAISLKTLKQNSKMIENSTRPYIGIYIASTYIRDVSCYLVVKNFGQSAATIRSFTYDFDLAKLSDFSEREPFKNIEGSTLMPQQSNKCVFGLHEALEEVKQINFHVVYSSGLHTYTDDICVSLNSQLGNFVTHNTSPNKELSIIAETLQDEYISSL